MTPVGCLRTPYPSTDSDSVRPGDRIPVVFIHGLWLHAGSWDAWLDLFRDHGYDPVAPGWPGEPEALQRLPVVVGHSFGGLLAQQLLASGAAAGAAALAPARFRGVLRLSPAELRASLPVLWNPLNRRRVLRQSPQRFHRTFANGLSERESNDLHATCVMPAPGRPLFQVAEANINPRSPLRVDTSAKRGPLLLAGASEDRVVPASVVRAAARRCRSSASPTEYLEMAGSGHSLVIDHGWRIAADTVLGFLARRGLAPEAADR